MDDSLALFKSDTRSFVVIEIANGEEIRRMDTNFNVYFRRFDCSQDGSLILTHDPHSIRLLQAETLRVAKRWTTTRREGLVRSFSFTNDPDVVALIYSGPTRLKLYDIKKDKFIDKIDWKIGKLTGVDYSIHSGVAAVSSETGKVLIWDL